MALKRPCASVRHTKRTGALLRSAGAVGRPAAPYANMLADAERTPEFVHFRALPGIFGDAPDDEVEMQRIVAILWDDSRPRRQRRDGAAFHGRSVCTVERSAPGADEPFRHGSGKASQA